MTHILVDTANMFFRARHVVRGDSIDTKIGMAMHIMFNSINNAWKDFDSSQVVFGMEGRSWRKDVYETYKRNRKVTADARTPKEKEEDEAFWKAFDELYEYLENKSNCTILQHQQCEADDFIARWIKNHPKDKHVIISSDSDFYQLIADNVSQYNGIMNQHITVDGVFNDKNQPVHDKKTGEQKQIGDPQYLLFEKCIRGDSSDNIFSAFPGARKKGTKNKIGMLEAYADRTNKGFTWNNFMLQRWVDHENVEHRVLEDYHRNKTLIDLTAQPDDIKAVLDETITNKVNTVPKGQIGLHFLRFCGKWDLQRLSDKASDHSKYLGASY